LRPKKTILSYFTKKIEMDSDQEMPTRGKKYHDNDEDFELKPTRRPAKKVDKTEKVKEPIAEPITVIEATSGEHIEEALDKIPKNKKALRKLYEKVVERIKFYRNNFIKEQVELAGKKSSIAECSIPICTDVRTFDFPKFVATQTKCGGRLFDVIMMDPPWQLSTSHPSRGVAIAYDSLSDDFIQQIPVPKLQENGFIFIWAINAKYSVACRLMEKWGYKVVDEITWVKKTVNGKIAKGHGFYLQHAKESCIIGVKGDISDKISKNIGCDVIFSERRGQSQKPEEIYQLIERMIPNGFYLEIFGRRNNVRDKWVTIGNEI